MHAHRALPSTCGRVLLALALAIAAPPRSARAAPSVSVQDPRSTARPRPARTREQQIPSTLYFISHADCVNDLVLHFPVSTSGSPADLRVLATATGDCLTPRGRATGTGPSACWPVPLRYPSPTGTADVHARDLVTNVLGIDCDGMPVGDAPRPPATPSAGARPVTLYFTKSPEGVDFSATPDAYFRWTRTSIEVRRPPAPEPRLGNGHAELLLALPPASDPSMTGYYVFCYPMELALGSGLGPAFGSGFGPAFGPPGGPPRRGPRRGAGADQCPPGTASLVDRASPDIASPFVCASQVPGFGGRSCASPPCTTVARSRTATATSSRSPRTTRCTTSARSRPSSAAAPQPTDTFMKVYCADGGEGCEGCGICNAGARGGLSWPLLGAGALAALGVALRRDGRRRSRGAGRR